jgi:lysyl-tRNA synthetase class 1
MKIEPEIVLKTNSWPFQQAQAILQKLNNKLPKKGYVLFETGYGPSGLPHIGTFGEVVRTTMVRNAFMQLSDIPTRLFCVSDDFDGMRKVPDNIPNPQDYLQYIGLPLTAIPDPFGMHESYGAHMNARLRSFLDNFGFEYEFKSATESYKSGEYNEYLLKVLQNYEKIMSIMLPTLREERSKTYSPFLPICPETGHVLQVPILSYNVERGEITYKNEQDSLITSPVTDGHCKLQWKPDFGMRWAAFDVDFEMYGKDHLVNGVIYTRICQAIGGKAPQQMFFELFLDENGQKISKSKGNGVSVDEWLRYAPKDSLALFMYQSPQKAKKLYFEIIPKTVDEYLTFLQKYRHEVDMTKKLANPIHHIHYGAIPDEEIVISYSLLINLISACSTDDPSVLWAYIKRVVPQAEPDKMPILRDMMQCAINYYQDFVKPNKQYRAPKANELQALHNLAQRLEKLPASATSEEIQTIVYQIGMDSGIELRDWFAALYEILLGASQGPRFGSFVAVYGINETIGLIKKAMSKRND